MRDKNRVCPVELSGGLDNRLRRWIHNPRKILAPYVREGMTVLDIGCGPGFFSLEAALLAGESGHVIACDLQEGMLDKLKAKISDTELEKRITPHKCSQTSLGLSEAVDFVLAFYMVHEVPDKERLFAEVFSLLKPGGRFLVVEPPFHVSKADFEAMLAKAGQAGFKVDHRPKMFLDIPVLFRKD